jgi:hypothetical protein
MNGKARLQYMYSIWPQEYHILDHITANEGHPDPCHAVASALGRCSRQPMGATIAYRAQIGALNK